MKSVYIEQVIKTLKNSSLFLCLNEKQLSKLAYDFCTVTDYKKGELIYSKGEKKKQIGVIMKGEALVTKDSLVINKLQKNDIFGAITLYNSDRRFINSISAYSDCTVVYVSCEGVDYAINNNTAFSKKYIEYLSDRIYFLNKKIQTYTTSKAEEKLYNFLLSVAENNTFYLEIKMTELARALSLSRASLYRCFDKLEADGKIKREGKEITIL